MTLNELLPALQQLNRGDKLRVMQFLVSELAKEEDLTQMLNSEYTVWTPYDAFGVAQALQEILENESSQDHD